MHHKWPTEKKVTKIVECEVCKVPSDIATIECPERPVTQEELAKIATGNLDYRAGKWRTYVDIS